MRGYRLTAGGGLDGIQAVDLPDPKPGANDVLIRVRATSLNYRDLMIARAARDEVVPLSDGAGEILEVGAAVHGLAPGDRVAGCFFPYWQDGAIQPAYIRAALGGGQSDGMLRELVVLPANAVVQLPGHMSFEEGATLPCAALTAWNGMWEQARLKPGQSVLLLGTGGVSIIALQLARAAGVRAIITSSSDEKLARARSLGADATINYRTREDWDRAVLDLTEGKGVDLTLEVGGAGTYAKSMNATRVGGHVVLIGGLSGQPSEGSGVPLLARNIHVTRIYVGSQRMFEDMNRALARNDIHPVIDRTFEFGEAVEAYRYLESQQHFGKIVIRA